MANLKIGSKGAEVKRLQEALLAIGYQLPRWGADSDLGGETFDAFAAFALDHGYSLEALAGNVLPPGVVKSVYTVLNAQLDEKLCQISFVDRTLYTGSLRRGLRDWTHINGIVLHQTACNLSSKPKRWDTLSAHIGIPNTKTPTIYLINPLISLMWHANSFNGRTVGIEINGNIEGIDGHRKTAWKNGGTIRRASEAQIAAGRKAVQWIVQHVQSHGGNVRFIFAHRQASPRRRADPGSRIWQEVGLWAKQELGLSDGGPGYTETHYKYGEGLPIPKEWDPSRAAKY